MAQGLTCLDQPVGSVRPGGTEHLARRRSGAGPGRERDARAAQLAGQRFGAPKRKISGAGRAVLRPWSVLGAGCAFLLLWSRCALWAGRAAPLLPWPRCVRRAGRAALLVLQHRREGLIAWSPAFLTCAEYLGETAEIDCCGGEQPSDPGLLVPNAALVCHAQHADLQPAAG